MARRPRTNGFCLGADLGGSWLRVCLADSQGRILRQARAPFSKGKNPVPLLRGFKKHWRLSRLKRLVLGSAGIWDLRSRRILKTALKGLAREITVLSDAELAHAAALGGEIGVVIIAGTGSIAITRDKKGKIFRAGGYGPLLGDEGSAFWIGRQALKDPALSRRLPSLLRLAHDESPVRRVAALARQIVSRAPNDQAAAALTRKACRELAHIVNEAADAAGLKDEIPVSWSGGLFQDAYFLASFRRALLALNKRSRSFQLRTPAMAPHIAAALFSLLHPGN